MRNKNATCGTSVTTPTGTFTYHQKKVNACQAKLECLKKGRILAPITNWADLDALRSIARIDDPSCDFHYGYKKYHVGLDVTKCGNKIYRFFTNGVAWNESAHGDLYKWVGSKKKDINVASFSPDFRKLFIVDRFKKAVKRGFICLQPNTPSRAAESLVGKDIVQNQSLNLLFAFMVAFAGIVLILSTTKKEKVKNKEIMKLKNEIEDLKHYKEEYKKMLKKLSLE